MTLGEKIKAARVARKMTQAELAKDKITRNMLSSIERGKASPSLDTLKFLAEELELPLPYLVSEDNDLAFYEKKERITPIRSALEAHHYNACIGLIQKLMHLDDELCFILAECYYNLGATAIKSGSLKSALKYLELCDRYSKQTVYDTKRFECTIPLYEAICLNVNSPLLEFDEKQFTSMTKETVDYEFYKYLVLDYSYDFTDPRYQKHINAKQLIKERNYNDALSLLLEIEEKKSSYEHNAYLMFCVYADIENCYRQIFDFEGAYRYASKRISLLEGFNL